ncbi:GH25 family lysozyme [Mogibacterium sp.]
MTRRIRIVLLLGVIFIFSIVFVNADESGDSGENPANGVVTENTVQDHNEQQQDNGTQIKSLEAETASRNHTDAQATLRSVQRPPIYNSWVDENGNRYYADGNGNYVRGIHEINGVIYFFDPNTGALKREAGWRTWGNGRYFTNGEGIAYRSRFITFGTPKFYMGIDGAVKTGIFSTLDGQLYNADDYTGEVIQVAQWIEKNGKRYFSNAEGALYKNQFITFGTPKFYMGADGAVKTGLFTTSDGQLYNADDRTGEIIQRAQWIEKNGKRYFSNAGGALYKNQFITFGILKFYMGIDGAVKTSIYSTPDGRIYNADDYTGEVIQVAQWIEKNGKKYFSNAAGELYKNQFISFGNTYYYMGSDGAVVVGSFYYNGESYTSNQEGIVNELNGPPGSSVLGIDVSYAQGAIDWNRVAKAGIKFAIIRAAFRGYGTGRIVADEWFERNIKGAAAAGIKVGVYFFSQAVNEKEGAEEADHIINQIRNYKVTLPVVIDTEYISDSRARGNLISKEIRTAAVKAFCERSLQRGYTPMIYASTSWLNNQLDMSKLSVYKVWVAQYYSRVTYNGKYQCWQYTSSGHVDGINTKVDMNYWYNR